jgi:hypothetical protein
MIKHYLTNGVDYVPTSTGMLAEAKCFQKSFGAFFEGP